MKIVIDNDDPEKVARQNELEEKVRASFATAAANALEFVAGGDEGDVVEAMKKFVSVHDAAERETIDTMGVPIQIPKLDRKPKGEPDPDDALNTIIRGALRMVAALLLHSSKIDNEDYERARDELAEGIGLFNKKLSASGATRTR